MLPELWWFWMLWRFAILISHLMNYFVCLDEMRCLRFAWAMVQSRVLGFLLQNVLFFTPFFLVACGNEFCWFYIICCTINFGLESCPFAVGRAPELFSTYALNLMWPVGYCYELERWWSWRARGKDLARCQGRQLQGIVSWFICLLSADVLMFCERSGCIEVVRRKVRRRLKSLTNSWWLGRCHFRKFYI